MREVYIIMNKRGQQEIVGFVLIVVLVVVGLMVFLVISLRDSPEKEGSLEVGNMLDVMMKWTTECAIVCEPDYDDLEDLFKSCYREDRCSNLDRSACDYLNESLRAVVGDMMKSEANVNAYQVDFFIRDGEGLLRVFESASFGKIGDCVGSISAAQRSVKSDSENLVVRMTVCRG